MTPEQLAAIKQRAELAVSMYHSTGPDGDKGHFWVRPDAAVVMARQDIPALLAYVEELEKELHHYHQEVGWSEADCQSGKCRQTPPMK